MTTSMTKEIFYFRYLAFGDFFSLYTESMYLEIIKL